MRRVGLEPGAGYEDWRRMARELLRSQTPPDQVSWQREAQEELLGEAPAQQDEKAVVSARVPRDFPDLAESLLAHADPQAPALAYRLLWRLTHGEPDLLSRVTDDDVMRALAWIKAVRRDAHKMKAFVRFREISAADGGEPVYVAWFEPGHYIVERLAPFFVRRFAGMRWSILTPYRSAHWDGHDLSFGPGALRRDAPADDALEDLWRTYYASIFNPARLKEKAMTREMPVKYWKNLPEARLIPGLMREAAPRRDAMVDQTLAAPNRRIRGGKAAPQQEAPEGSLDQVRRQAHDCRRCDLWKPATQTVFGEGPAHAHVMLIGEQPGDQEDLAGKPFVGPAGKLLDRALEAAGLSRDALYVTNTVKHFKFEPRGKVRLHKRADAAEQRACRPWLDAEIARVKPRLIVCLGSMAANALLGSAFRLLKQRGTWHEREDGSRVIATVHPSYLLRLPDAEAREQGFADFVADLRRVAKALKD